QLLIDKQPYPALLRLLNNSNVRVISNAIESIYNLLLNGSNTTPPNTEHPHFQIIQEAKGIEKIFELFCKDRSSKYQKDDACLCLGILFRAQVIPWEMKNSIIKHLKTLLTDSNEYTKNSAKLALEELIQNEGNQKNDDDDEEEDDDNNDDKE
ncbi:MAG: hypothetical protein EZS28_039883, partial [Streblomastix strix]